MKIVIDIPEEMYQSVLNGTYCGTLYEELKNGTPQPKAGHWVSIDEEPHEVYECDRCGRVVSTFTANIEPHIEYKYCPNCGARMVEPQESEEEE